MTGRAWKWWARGRESDGIESRLHHIVVAGGSWVDWAEFGEEDWTRRLESLAEVARRAGARYVTVRPYEVGSGDPLGSGRVGRSEVHRRESRVATEDRDAADAVINVVVDPVVDGRQRICDAVAALPEGIDITEEVLDRALHGDAGEPDLVVVLGPPDRLPRSLVWELAYSELVFVGSSWRDLSSDDLVQAVREYARRSRRFGGVDE
ncbi:MAG: undecaprenyl diphosphate synthase family protein [Actinomycetota bacterium]